MNKPDQSQDGVYRATVEVRHRIDSDALILAALDLANHREIAISDIARLKKGEIESYLRDCLVEGGRHWREFGGERLGPTWLEKAEPLAEATIKVLWPDFFEATRL